MSGIKDEIACERETIESLEKEADCMKADIDSLQNQLKEARSLISERETKKVELHKHEEENRELVAEEQRLAEQIAYFQELIQMDRQALLELEKEHSSIEAMKQANDATEAEKLIPGRAEFNELQLENEKLDSFLETSIECLETKKVQEEILSIETTNAELEKEISKILEVIEEKKSMQSELQKSIDDLNESNNNEINDITIQKERIMKEKEEIQKSIEEKKNAIAKLNEEKEENSKNLENELLVLKRKYYVLRSGKKVIDKTAKTKSILDGTRKESTEKKK